MPRRFIGNIISSEGNKDLIKIENARTLNPGQRVAVYVPTDSKIQNSEKSKCFGYKNRLIEVVPIEKNGDDYYVKVTTPAIKTNITSNTRKIRKFKNGDVIIKIIDK